MCLRIIYIVHSFLFFFWCVIFNFISCSNANNAQMQFLFCLCTKMHSAMQLKICGKIEAKNDAARTFNAHTICNRTFNHFSTTLFYNVAYFKFRFNCFSSATYFCYAENVTCGWHTHLNQQASAMFHPVWMTYAAFWK